MYLFFFFFSSRRRHTRLQGDWSSDVCSSDLARLDALERPEVGPETTDGVLRVKLDEINELIAAHPARAHAQRGGEPGRRWRGRSGRRGKVQLDPLAVAIGGQDPAPCVAPRPPSRGPIGVLPQHLPARQPPVA